MDRRSQITALLISPDRGIATQFRNWTTRSRAFEMIGDLQAYPNQQALEGKLRQLLPEVILLDVATSLTTAGELIRYVASLRPAIPVIALHSSNDSESILKVLREGATEFLYAPFEVSIQEAAINRIRKILEPISGGNRERGRVVVFTNAKPGSGSSTLALQTSYALKRTSKRRVLLADFDLSAGMLDFYLKVAPERSIADLLQSSEPIGAELWSSAVVHVDGIDVLPAPALPYTDAIDPVRIHQILEYARATYEWIVIDLPNICNRLSFMCVSESDRGFLVSTPDLASLHLTRRAVKLMTQLAIDPGKYQVLLNRLDDRAELSSSDLSKLFECPVDKGLPNERMRLERVHTLGQPLDGSSNLGKAIEGLATKLIGALPERQNSATLLAPRPAFSQT